MSLWEHDKWFCSCLIGWFFSGIPGGGRSVIDWKYNWLWISPPPSSFVGDPESDPSPQVLLSCYCAVVTGGALLCVHEARPQHARCGVLACELYSGIRPVITDMSFSCKPASETEKPPQPHRVSSTWRPRTEGCQQGRQLTSFSALRSIHHHCPVKTTYLPNE